jgi:hypothetical protein
MFRSPPSASPAPEIAARRTSRKPVHGPRRWPRSPFATPLARPRFRRARGARSMPIGQRVCERG